MKKQICVLLCAALFLSISACSGQKTDESEKYDYTVLSEKAQTMSNYISMATAVFVFIFCPNIVDFFTDSQEVLH